MFWWCSVVLCCDGSLACSFFCCYLYALNAFSQQAIETKCCLLLLMIISPSPSWCFVLYCFDFVILFLFWCCSYLCHCFYFYCCVAVVVVLLLRGCTHFMKYIWRKEGCLLLLLVIFSNVSWCAVFLLLFSVAIAIACCVLTFS